MPTRVLAEHAAIDRLAEFGLTTEIVERVVRRADAEASMCTALDPPIMEGLTRWARTNRFLREEPGARDAATWLLLFHVDEDGFRAELSLPNAIVEGRITGSAERIILPAFPRDEDRLAALLTAFGADQDEDIVVAVNRR